jgi:hypothetical protein
MSQEKQNLASDRMLLKQLQGHVEELGRLTDMLGQLLLMVEEQVMPKRVPDLSLAIAMSHRLARTTKATLLLARALQAGAPKSQKA